MKSRSKAQKRLQGCYVTIAAVKGGLYFYAELWQQPYSGKRLAQTSIWRNTPQAAGRDAQKVFGVRWDKNGKIL